MEPGGAGVLEERESRGGGGSERDCRNRRFRRSRERASRERAPHLRPLLPFRSVSGARWMPSQYLPAKTNCRRRQYRTPARIARWFSARFSPVSEGSRRERPEPDPARPTIRPGPGLPFNGHGIPKDPSPIPRRRGQPAFSSSPTGSATPPGPRSGSRP